MCKSQNNLIVNTYVHVHVHSDIISRSAFNFDRKRYFKLGLAREDVIYIQVER
jgi:hypothetical protein